MKQFDNMGVHQRPHCSFPQQKYEAWFSIDQL